jgi:hypothetical protein
MYNLLHHALKATSMLKTSIQLHESLQQFHLEEYRQFQAIGDELTFIWYLSTWSPLPLFSLGSSKGRAARRYAAVRQAKIEAQLGPKLKNIVTISLAGVGPSWNLKVSNRSETGPTCSRKAQLWIEGQQQGKDIYGVYRNADSDRWESWYRTFYPSDNRIVPRCPCRICHLWGPDRACEVVDQWSIGPLSQTHVPWQISMHDRHYSTCAIRTKQQA